MFLRTLQTLSFALLLVSGYGLASASALAPDASQTIAAKTAGMHREDGFFPVVRDDKAGKLYLEVKGDSQDFLLLDHIPYGLGLDRPQTGSRTAGRGPSVVFLPLRQQDSA